MTKTRCLVFSRVVGYITPVENWHEGKQSEFKDRKLFGGVKNVESVEKKEVADESGQTHL